MASTFKNFASTDIVNTKPLLHEAIPLTGTIVSGTYSENNVKNYSHGMFQSVYDYPYLSSSANHIFDVTVGYHASSSLSASTATQNSKKINVYNQMAQVLMGYDVSGNVLQFDQDGDLTGGTKINEAYFVNFSRLLVKDEIKKGTFELKLGVNNNATWRDDPNNKRIKVYDKDAATDYRVNASAGEYAILYATGSSGADLIADDDATSKVGLIFYQAGVIVLSSSVFAIASEGGILHNTTYSTRGPVVHPSGSYVVADALSSGSISGSADALRSRIVNISFNNTTELNSTIYFCRINHNDFNYSSNPTYLSGSKIRTKRQASDNPVTYITTVGLYSADRELLAVGKISEPLKNDPTQDMTLRVRLDY